MTLDAHFWAVCPGVTSNMFKSAVDPVTNKDAKQLDGPLNVQTQEQLTDRKFHRSTSSLKYHTQRTSVGVSANA